MDDFSEVLQLRKEGLFGSLIFFRVIHSAAVCHVFQEYSPGAKGRKVFSRNEAGYGA